MNIKNIKELVVKHLDSYSQNGKVLEQNSGTMQDYALRIPDFINYGITLISRTIPTLSLLVLDEILSTTNGQDYYKLPDDFMGIATITSAPEHARYIGAVSVVGNLISVPTVATSISIMYKQLPPAINVDTPVTEELPLREDLCPIVALYVCAMLIMDEDANLSTRFLNQFEVELSRINDTNFYGAEFPVSTTGWN